MSGATDLPCRTTALRADRVSLSYGSAPVVRDVDLRLEPGRVTALIGPNGSGKSTLLRAAAGLHPIGTGEVLVSRSGRTDGAEEQQLRHFSPRQLARELTLLSQHRPTPGGLRVRDVVEFGRHPHRGRWRSADPDGPTAVARALELTCLDTLADVEVDTLSGGQLQRVWLASCLAQDTAVLLLDEPTNHLDLHHQVDLLRLVRTLADVHGVTVGVVLHDLEQAAAIADHVVLLDDGEVVACGAPEDVLCPDRLTAVYGVKVAVRRDEATGLLRISALGGLADLATAPQGEPAMALSA